MIIYESGYSVANKQLGLIVPYKTYICVFEEDVEEVIEISFAKMQEFLEKEKSVQVISTNIKEWTIVDINLNRYTLCHERIFNTDNTITCKNSNVIRHIFSQKFTKDCLYIDENEQIVDLVGRAIKDINNYILKSQTNFVREINSDPDIILETLYLMINSNWRPCGDITDCFSNFTPKTILQNKEKYLEKICAYDSSIFSALLYNYGALRNYFFDTCGLIFEPKLKPACPKPEELKLNKAMAGYFA